MAITPFKVIQGHRFWYQSKAHIRFPIGDYTNTYILSCTVSKLWLIIGQIFASDRRALHFNARSGGDPPRISSKVIYRWKLNSLRYISLAKSIGLYSTTFT